ncbi:unnamed protein product [Taenia asiatica]|uniref:Alpha-galactosidase n=1 Tax=Taenia asiatica TaxID=60517 RepID=A0A0R3WGX3_TAEAS|nr:unnamed protein product [Taenia asiatica]
MEGILLLNYSNDTRLDLHQEDRKFHAKLRPIIALGGGIHQLLVPCDMLTDCERKRYRCPNHGWIGYLQYWGYRLACKPANQQADITKTGTMTPMMTTTTTAP